MELRILITILASFVSLGHSQYMSCNRPADCAYGFYCHTYLGEQSLCLRCINCGEYKRSAGGAPCATNVLEDCGPCLFGYRDKTSYDVYRTEKCVRSPHYPRNSGVLQRPPLLIVSAAIFLLTWIHRFWN